MKPAPSIPSPLASAGFTLLEIMICLVLIAVALLGIAGLQMNNLRYSSLSAGRAQAALIAEQMADRIRANSGASYGGVSGTNNNCYSATCTAAQQAAFDIYEVGLMASDTIRGGLQNGTVSVSNAYSSSTLVGYNITLTWSERATSKASSQTQTMTVFMKP